MGEEKMMVEDRMRKALWMCADVIACVLVSTECPSPNTVETLMAACKEARAAAKLESSLEEVEGDGNNKSSDGGD